MFDKLESGKYWDKPWSLVSGCTRCSPGCDHCWALAIERRFSRDVVYDPQVKIHPERIDIPIKRRKPTVWAIWNDLFHEDVPEDFIKSSWDVMQKAQRNNHIFLVLTKRAKRMQEILKTCQIPVYNIWLGVTVCNQAEADQKIPSLLQIPAALRWVSLEPMLSEIHIEQALSYNKKDLHPDDTGGRYLASLKGIDWVVCGGETGPGTHPLDPQWVESIRNQCAGAGVPFFFKSWGEWRGNYPGDSWEPNGMKYYYFARIAGPKAWRCGKRLSGRLLDGREWNEIPGRT